MSDNSAVAIGLNFLRRSLDEMTRNINRATSTGSTQVDLPGKRDAQGQVLQVGISTPAGQMALKIWNREMNNMFQAGQKIADALDLATAPDKKRDLKTLAENFNQAVIKGSTRVALPGIPDSEGSGDLSVDLSSHAGQAVLDRYLR